MAWEHGARLALVGTYPGTYFLWEHDELEMTISVPLRGEQTLVTSILPVTCVLLVMWLARFCPSLNPAVECG